MMPAAPTIAVLDLDQALVRRLTATHPIVTWTRRREPPTAPAAILISSLRDDAALVHATSGPDNILDALADGAIHATTGMHGRGAIEQVSREHERRGRRFIAAPLLLSPAGGNGSVVLGGAAEAVESIEPVFTAMGVSIAARCERSADATLLALAHSTMLACAIEAIAEAFVLVRKYGVDPAVMRDVMAEALFAGTVYAPLADAMLAQVDAGAPSVARFLAILDLACGAANGAHVPLPAIDACRDRLLSAIARGDGERAWTVIEREQARASGLD